jgi:hypothetical protein
MIQIFTKAFRRNLVRGVGIGLCLLALLPMTGCATLIFPERSLVPPGERRGIDGILLTVDIVASVPFAALGSLLVLACVASPGSYVGGDFWKLFYLPVAVDLNHGTLFLPKEGAASLPRN